MLQERRFKMKDNNGRAYALISNLNENDRVETDDGFTCLKDGEVCIVHKGVKDYLYIYCSEGIHFLGEQVVDDYYLGLYKI